MDIHVKSVSKHAQKLVIPNALKHDRNKGKKGKIEKSRTKWTEICGSVCDRANNPSLSPISILIDRDTLSFPAHYGLGYLISPFPLAFFVFARFAVPYQECSQKYAFHCSVRSEFLVILR